MKNFIHEGRTLSFTAPEGGVDSGVPAKVGDIIGIPAITAPAGAPFELYVEGVYELPKGAIAITEGKKVYWDATAQAVTTTATGNTLIGHAAQAAAEAGVSVRVRLSV